VLRLKGESGNEPSTIRKKFKMKIFEALEFEDVQVQVEIVHSLRRRGKI